MCDAQVPYHHALPQHPGGSQTAVSWSKAGYGFGCVLTVDTFLLYKYNLSIVTKMKKKVCPITPYQMSNFIKDKFYQGFLLSLSNNVPIKDRRRASGWK